MYSKRIAKASLKDNNSPATSYLLSVLEEKARGDVFSSKSTATARVHSAFSAFDEIIPHCGVYTPVLKLIKEELIDAVYSETYTTSSAQDTGSAGLERVPYFTLLQRLHEERTDSKELLEELKEKHIIQVKKLKEVISEKEKIIVELNEEIVEVKANVERLSKHLTEQDEFIEKLQKEIESNQLVAEDVTSQLKMDIEEIASGRDGLQQEIEGLRKYKVSYDTLKDTFDLPPDKRPRRGFRRPIVSTKKTRLLSSIEAASKLEQQMIEVQTKSLEEYDQYLEEVKLQLTHKQFSDNESDRDYFIEELQLETLSDEMRTKLKNFQRLITGTVVELELMREHRDALQSQLSQMEQAENPAVGDTGSNAGTLPPSSMAGGPGSSRMMTHDEVGKKTSIGRESQISLESGLEEDTTPLVDANSDPFNPQERLLSKYSAMIYTSINSGKTFDEITIAKFCKSCGEKTAVCPHKVTKSDLIAPLPPGCTHIKVTRPMVRIALPSMSQNGLSEADIFGQQSHGKWEHSISESRLWGGSDEVDPSIRRQLNPLWQDAKRRAGIDAQGSSTSICASRDLSKSRTVSMVEQFYSSVIWRDEHLHPDEDLSTLREFLYNFMRERYQEEEISCVASYDFVTAVVKYAINDKTILILGLTLAGLLDGCVVRYLLVVADLVNSVDWQNVEDFSTFSEILYPSLEEDDLELFVMEYTAYSENKISKSLVFNYITHLLIKNKEPRIFDAEARLSASKMKEKGLMSFEEFINAMENISPLASDQLLERLAKECMLTFGSQLVPLKRWSSVTAYISLLQVWNHQKDQLGPRLEEARQNVQASTKLKTSPSLIPEAGTLITMSQVKLLAGNISRLRRSGNSQSQQSFNDDFYWQSRPNTRDSTF